MATFTKSPDDPRVLVNEGAGEPDIDVEIATSPVGLGEAVSSKYVVERVIGEGVASVVVAARHRELGQRVAVKFLLPAIAQQAGASERFRRAARAAARIRGEHVCRVLDVGTAESGVPFIVMEYLEGRDLACELEERGVLPYAEAIEWVLQACEALAEAHALALVHRDLKPANLFLETCPDGTRRIKVLDFGVSKALRELHAASDVPEPIDTPLYMAPEQLESPREADARTDVWGLAVVLFELLTGRTPFQAESVPQLLTAILHDPPARLGDWQIGMPDGLDRVLRRALEKAREDRYPSVQEFAKELRPFLQPAAASEYEAARLALAAAIAKQDADPTLLGPLPKLDASLEPPLTVVAPALRGGALTDTAPALRGGALTDTAPALRGGALTDTAPAPALDDLEREFDELHELPSEEMVRLEDDELEPAWASEVKEARDDLEVLSPDSDALLPASLSATAERAADAASDSFSELAPLALDAWSQGSGAAAEVAPANQAGPSEEPEPGRPVSGVQPVLLGELLAASAAAEEPQLLASGAPEPARPASAGMQPMGAADSNAQVGRAEGAADSARALFESARTSTSRPGVAAQPAWPNTNPPPHARLGRARGGIEPRAARTGTGPLARASAGERYDDVFSGGSFGTDPALRGGGGTSSIDPALRGGSSQSSALMLAPTQASYSLSPLHPPEYAERRSTRRGLYALFALVAVPIGLFLMWRNGDAWLLPLQAAGAAGHAADAVPNSQPSAPEPQLRAASAESTLNAASDPPHAAAEPAANSPKLPAAAHGEPPALDKPLPGAKPGSGRGRGPAAAASGRGPAAQARARAAAERRSEPERRAEPERRNDPLFLRSSDSEPPAGTISISDFGGRR